MYVRQTDRNFVHACEAYLKSKADNLNFYGRTGRLFEEGNALIEQAAQRMAKAIGRVDKEAVEASEARTALMAAEEALNISFGDLYDGAFLAQRFSKLGSSERATGRSPDIDRYLEGNSPSTFSDRGRPDKKAIMKRALEYADRYLADSPVPDDVVTRAHEVFVDYVAAFEKLQAEEGDVLTQRNEADKDRVLAHRDYRAGRQVIKAALTLADSPQPIHEILPSLTRVLRGRTLAGDDETVEPVEPAEA